MIALEFNGHPPTHKMARAGYEAEKLLAFYLDRAFRETADFRVFHGLRVQRHEDAAQIDHLVLHRYGFVLIESKSIVEAVEINEHAEFSRVYRGQRQGMPSPILQAKRQQDLLQLLLNDHKTTLRRVVGIGPLKKQAEFSDDRFEIIAAISDKGRIVCHGDRPKQVMKAEAVVQTINDRVEYLHSIAKFSSFALSIFDRKKSREIDENHLLMLTDEELDAITQFLLAYHTPLPPSKTTEKPISATHELIAELPRKTPVTPHASQATKLASTSVEGNVAAAPSARKGAARNMARWTAEEEDRLRERHTAGCKPEDVAAEFGRTAKALRLRAVKMGLITDVADWS